MKRWILIAGWSLCSMSIPAVGSLQNRGESTNLVQSSDVRVELKLTSGELVSARLRQITSDEIVLLELDTARPFKFSDIAELRFAERSDAGVSPKYRITLRDGSVLSAASLLISGAEAEAVLVGGWRMHFPILQIRSIELKEIQLDVARVAQWNQILNSATRTSDVIVVDRNGELETIEGSLGDLRDDKVGFTIGERSANIDLNKLEGIIFYQPTDPQIPVPVATLKVLDGSILKLQQIGWQDGKLTGTTLTGLKIEVLPLFLAAIDFAMSRDVYLDDLPPATNDWNPLIASAATLPELRKLNLATLKRALNGQALSLTVPSRDGDPSGPRLRQFLHGFAIRGGGKIAFTLNGEFAKLTGWIGFDPAANADGHVLLTIRLDTRIVFEQVLINQEMHEPVALNLDLTGAQRIVFQVNYQDGRSVGDQIHAVDLKVSK